MISNKELFIDWQNKNTQEETDELEERLRYESENQKAVERQKEFFNHLSEVSRLKF